MPPLPVLLRMDTGSGSPPSSMVAGPPPLWRLAERRSRKAGSGNIFSDVNLWQLQRLFRAAGDQDAEQRAQLIWGHRDEAELAQALVALRARSHHRGLRTNGRDILGSRWLRAFNHLRIGESLPSSQGKDPANESESESGAHSSPEPHRHTSVGTTGRGTVATVALNKSQGPTGTSERPVRAGVGLRRGGEKNDPERYLHRILH
ncbi:arginine vasopressin-induced protein 1 [Scomber japonicus]|uniref:arginine vasopressin-induced protein 1 n=1 Tax=Scomber japonicus TaxID=13676 RepID=UPI002304D9D6|nr:arginine vasopressin-induced protein 1 [Scomber japonicus]